MDTFPPVLQRPALLEFAAALCSRDAALRRDECGDWKIEGKLGHVYAYAPGRYQFFVMGWAALGWANAKKALAFARLCNDGEDEGGFLLDCLPTTAEAKSIRHYLGLNKRTEFSPDYVAELQARARGWSKKPASAEAALLT